LRFGKEDARSEQVRLPIFWNKRCHYNSHEGFSGSPVREIITLQCSECKRRNYTTTRNKKDQKERIELKKFCKFCRKHTVHKEVK
jgi:large subunit ribosomal protein L33